jgi:SAM-dependent methyltransferase
MTAVSETTHANHSSKESTLGSSNPRSLGLETQIAARPEPGQVAMVHPVACPLCGASRESWELNATTLGAGPFGKDLFSIYRCRNCAIGITDPVPTEEESRLLYADRTSLDFQPDDSSIGTVLKNAVADRDVRRLVTGAQLAQPPRTILDYACGNGAFSLSLRRNFPKSTVWATDYHADAPPMIQGTEIHYAKYADLSAHGPFDLILCRHVLEHTYNPVKFLRELADMLSSGGILMIEVPNLEAPLRRVFGKYWDGYYVPYHPIHFSKASLKRSAVDAGLVPVKTGCAEMPKIGRSLRNVVACDYNPLLFAAGVLLHPAQIIAKLLTNKPTCLRMWARKP